MRIIPTKGEKHGTEVSGQWCGAVVSGKDER